MSRIRAAVPLIATIAAVAALGACAGPAGLPGPHPAADRDVARAVTNHYERFGVEENFSCLAAYMDGITRWEVLEDTGNELVVHVGYYYKDRVRSDAFDDSMLRVGPLVHCTGFSERVFTVDVSGERPQVVEMTGPVAGGARS